MSFPRSGIRVLTAAQAQDVDLGPLTQLQGTWVNAPLSSPDRIAQGWNVIAVPGTPSFTLEIIPYTETLTFTPVVVADNRGPFINGQEVTQQITGLMYKQEILSACPTDFCAERGFKAGTMIHAETGLLLNLGSPDGGYTVARLATIPHGNSVLCLGQSAVIQPGLDHSFIGTANTIPTNLDGSPLSSKDFLFNYADGYIGAPFLGVFFQSDPNTFLTSTIEGMNITDMTVIKMSSNNPNAGGGILNIPFISSNVNATQMDFIFWIETVEGLTSPLLQYTQTINLVFPPTGNPHPVLWPHVTVNTLTKVS